MDTEFLAGTPLFRGAAPGEVQAMLDCLGAQVRRYPKGAAVLRAGETTPCLGVVLAGSVCVENDDFWGNKSILDRIGPGQVFGETYACAGVPLLVSAVAAEAAEILFLNVSRLLTVCPSACAHHTRLVGNLLAISAQKNLTLSRRMFHTAPKTIRGRLLSYLSDGAARSGDGTFTAPYNRQQLADYLGVDRSALSHELSKMRREGILEVEGNRFRLLRRL